MFAQLHMQRQDDPGAPVCKLDEFYVLSDIYVLSDNTRDATAIY